jgi:intracellular septation protein
MFNYLMWVAFFILMGILNLIIAYSFSEYIWVKFKVFGGFGLMILFTIISGLFIYSKTRGVQNEL